MNPALAAMLRDLPRARPLRTVCMNEACRKVLLDVPEDERGVSHGACDEVCWKAARVKRTASRSAA